VNEILPLLDNAKKECHTIGLTLEVADPTARNLMLWINDVSVDLSTSQKY